MTEDETFTLVSKAPDEDYKDFIARLMRDDRPWYQKAWSSLRWKCSRTWDRIIDTAHRPFYRYTVPRVEGSDLGIDGHCLHRYCHAGSNLGTYLYLNAHYVTRDLSQLWMKHESCVAEVMAIKEPTYGYSERYEKIGEIIAERLNSDDEEWDVDGLVREIMTVTDGKP